MTMKSTFKTLVLGLSILGAATPALAQPYGYGRDRDYGYDRDRSEGDYDRRPRYRDPSYEDDRRGGYGRGGGFDAAEYLRCNPDVRRALRNGQITSAQDHWRVFGRREGRRLSC
jgi:hypothetical protein